MGQDLRYFQMQTMIKRCFDELLSQKPEEKDKRFGNADIVKNERFLILTAKPRCTNCNNIERASRFYLWT